MVHTVTSVLRRLRQKDGVFEANLGYINRQNKKEGTEGRREGEKKMRQRREKRESGRKGQR